MKGDVSKATKLTSCLLFLLINCDIDMKAIHNKCDETKLTLSWVLNLPAINITCY